MAKTGLTAEHYVAIGQLLDERIRESGLPFPFPEEGDTAEMTEANVRNHRITLATAFFMASAKRSTTLNTDRETLLFFRVIRSEYHAIVGDPPPLSHEQLARIFAGVPVGRRGRPRRTPDPASLVGACRERGIEVPFEQLLSASELEQLEAFLEGASDEQLAERWKVKVVSVRSRRSRLGAKLQQIISEWREVNMSAPRLVERVSDLELRLIALEERYEAQRAQIEELAREVGREFCNQRVSEAVEHFLASL
jgi:hypothetical protein